MNKRKTLLLAAAVILCIGLIIGGIAVVKNQQTKMKVQQLYTQWEKTYVVNTEEGNYINGSEIEGQRFAISEAQGYGMLLSLAAADYGWSSQQDFDALTSYYLKHRISESNQLMAWKQLEINGNMTTDATQNVSATDGDLDIAYALLQADEKWGSQGQFNYLSLANQLLESLLNYTYQQETQLLAVGNWAINSEAHRNLIRTSDLIPAYYRYFYQKTQQKTWERIADQAQKVLMTLSNQTATGLIPDFAMVNQNIYPAPSNSLEGNNDGNYAWNAARIPWRLALSKDTKEQAVNEKLLRFFADQPRITAGYTLSGDPLNENDSPVFTASIAIAANQQQTVFSGLAEKTRTAVLEKPLVGTYYADTLQTIASFYLLKLEEN